MPKGGWLLYALVFIVVTAMALFSIPAEQFEWQGALLMVAAGLLGVVIAYGIVPFLEFIERSFLMDSKDWRPAFTLCIVITLCLLSLPLLLPSPYWSFIFRWEHTIMLTIAIASFIVSTYSTYITHPEWKKGQKGRIHIGVLASLFLIVLINFDIFGANLTENVFFWLFMVITPGLAFFEARDTRNIRIVLGTLEQPLEKTFTFPNGISFSHPGKYEVDMEDSYGDTYLANLKDILNSKGILYERRLEMSPLFHERIPEMPPSFLVSSYKNDTGQTISDIMYLREKNSKKTRQLTKTTIAGREALLHEEYIYDEIYRQDALHRTMTVLFGDIVVMVMSIAYDKNRIEECLITAKKIENSLRFPATSASEWSFSPAASSYASVQPLGSDINKNNIHYLTLGLQHGATQDEIRTAFQRMTEKYHPDKDSSLDAQMKFHEARLAYDALIKGDKSD